MIRDDEDERPVRDGGPAFPDKFTTGMSLRDYFAAHALQGLLADPGANGSTHDYAHYAYRYADAMLDERDT